MTTTTSTSSTTTRNTVVTAIYHHSYNSRIGGRSWDFSYYENPFRNILSLNVNIIVFSHASEIPRIISFFEKNSFVDYKVIEYDLDRYVFSDQIYDMKEKRQIIDKNGLMQGRSHVDNDRNTHLCLSKIEFLRIAISNNYFASDNYYWIDAGLFHNGLFPTSLGGRERRVAPIIESFWPIDKNNVCTPDLIDKLNNKINTDDDKINTDDDKINTGDEEINEKLVFIGMTVFSQPTWWGKVYERNKRVHIIGGLFGGDKHEIMNMYNLFQDLTKKIIDIGELTLEEDILSIIVIQNEYKYLTFDAWNHDVPTDPCYYNIVRSDQKSFYKLFI